LAGRRRNNGQHDAIIRIDEAINGPNGVLSEMHRLNSDLFSVKLVLVGGLDPATGKEKQGLAQSYTMHVSDHRKRERRNSALITGFATLIATAGMYLYDFLFRK